MGFKLHAAGLPVNSGISQVSAILS